MRVAVAVAADLADLVRRAGALAAVAAVMDEPVEPAPVSARSKPSSRGGLRI
jgi:hypothetical protein